MKWKPPEWLLQQPSWHVLFWGDAVIGCLGGALMIVSYPSWIALADAAMVGIMFNSMIHIRRRARLVELLDAQRENITALQAWNESLQTYNQALIENKVLIHIQQIGTGDDDSPPIAPKLH